MTALASASTTIVYSNNPVPSANGCDNDRASHARSCSAWSSPSAPYLATRRSRSPRTSFGRPHDATSTSPASTGPSAPSARRGANRSNSSTTTAAVTSGTRASRTAAVTAAYRSSAAASANRTTRADPPARSDGQWSSSHACAPPRPAPASPRSTASASSCTRAASTRTASSSNAPISDPRSAPPAAHQDSSTPVNAAHAASTATRRSSNDIPPDMQPTYRQGLTTHTHENCCTATRYGIVTAPSVHIRSPPSAPSTGNTEARHRASPPRGPAPGTDTTTRAPPTPRPSRGAPALLTDSRSHPSAAQPRD